MIFCDVICKLDKIRMAYSNLMETGKDPGYQMNEWWIALVWSMERCVWYDTICVRVVMSNDGTYEWQLRAPLHSPLSQRHCLVAPASGKDNCMTIDCPYRVFICLLCKLSWIFSFISNLTPIINKCNANFIKKWKIQKIKPTIKYIN